MEEIPAGPDSPATTLIGGTSPRQDGRRHVLWLVVVLVCSFAGLTVSSHLVSRHLGASGRLAALLTPFCGAESAACDQVMASRWGKIVLGRASTPEGTREVSIPTAMVGLLYFGAVFAWYLFVGRTNHAGRIWQVPPLCVVVCGTGFSAWLVYVLFAELPEPCPLCLGSHAANAGLLLGTLMLWPRRPGTTLMGTSARSRPSLRLGLAGIALSVICPLLVARTLAYDNALRVMASERARLAGYLQDADLMAYLWRRQPPREIPIGPEDPVRGPFDAVHTAVVFSDFLCPHCRNLSLMLEERVRHLPGVTLRVVYKYHPIDGDCNPHVEFTRFARACDAAFLAEAIRLRHGNDAFWQAHDLLFEAGSTLSAAGLRSIAEKVGIPPAELEQAVSSAEVRNRVAATVSQAKELGVSHTPTVFLDGRMVEAWHRIETWAQILSTSG